jgi:hypothetical protein
MTTVSSREFSNNQKRYFDLAMNEELYIKRGKKVFHLIYASADNSIGTVADSNDEYISKEELLAEIHQDIDRFYAHK